MDLILPLAPWQILAETVSQVTPQATLYQSFSSQVLLQAVDPTSTVIVEARMMTDASGKGGSTISTEASPVTQDMDDDETSSIEDKRVTVNSQTLSRCLKMFWKNDRFRIITGEISDKVIVSSCNAGGSIVHDLVINEQEAQDWIDIPAELESDLIVKVDSGVLSDAISRATFFCERVLVTCSRTSMTIKGERPRNPGDVSPCFSIPCQFSSGDSCSVEVTVSATKWAKLTGLLKMAPICAVALKACFPLEMRVFLEHVGTVACFIAPMVDE